MWVTKLLISPVKKKDFLPKKGQIWPKICFLGYIDLAGSFGALMVGGCGLRAVSCVTPIYFFILRVDGRIISPRQEELS